MPNEVRQKKPTLGTLQRRMDGDNPPWKHSTTLVNLSDRAYLTLPHGKAICPPDVIVTVRLDIEVASWVSAGEAPPPLQPTAGKVRSNVNAPGLPPIAVQLRSFLRFPVTHT